MNIILIIQNKTRYNESTAGADASVEALKLYDMKLLHAFLKLDRSI